MSRSGDGKSTESWIRYVMYGGHPKLIYCSVLPHFYLIIQYLRFVKTSYDNFVQPSSKFADIVCKV